MTSERLLPLMVAGHQISDPVGELAAYGLAHQRTVERYDGAGVGDPDVLTIEEVGRSRVIASRISKAHAAWFAERGRSAPWRAVPPAGALADADPAEEDGLYDEATDLYEHFRADAPQGVSVAKLHKVLHIKRPALYPILDSHLLAMYRDEATAAARAYPKRAARSLYWAAIRRDLIRDENHHALADTRRRLASYTSYEPEQQKRVRAMALPPLGSIRVL